MGRSYALPLHLGCTTARDLDKIEFEFAKLLIKRKERDGARRPLETAIAFLRPLGDSVGMRNAEALLATLDARWA